jgi:hypothetical protein
VWAKASLKAWFTSKTTPPSTTSGPTGAAVGAGFIQRTFLAQIKAAFFELSLLRLCPPLPNHEMGQNGQL